MCTQATSVQHAIDLDLALLETAMACGDGRAHVRLWQNQPCLVVPRAYAKKPGFKAACQASTLPIALRRSGGHTAIHGPAFLTISVAQRLTAPSIDAAYAPLLNILTPAFARLGIPITTSPVPAAYCDGAYNLTANQQKLAGTAAMIKKQQGQSCALAHATVHLAFDQAHLLHITSFENALGIQRSYDIKAHTAVRDLLG